MGTDIHIVIERRGEDGVWYTAIQLYDLGRNYKFFEKIRDKGNPGLPLNVASWTTHLLKDGCWGQGWMMMKEFRKLKHVDIVVGDIELLKCKDDDNLRVVFAFDS